MLNKIYLFYMKHFSHLLLSLLRKVFTYSYTRTWILDLKFSILLIAQVDSFSASGVLHYSRQREHIKASSRHIHQFAWNDAFRNGVKINPRLSIGIYRCFPLFPAKYRTRTSLYNSNRVELLRWIHLHYCQLLLNTLPILCSISFYCLLLGIYCACFRKSEQYSR